MPMKPKVHVLSASDSRIRWKHPYRVPQSQARKRGRRCRACSRRAGNAPRAQGLSVTDLRWRSRSASRNAATCRRATCALQAASDLADRLAELQQLDCAAAQERDRLGLAADGRRGLCRMFQASHRRAHGELARFERRCAWAAALAASARTLGRACAGRSARGAVWATAFTSEGALADPARQQQLEAFVRQAIEAAGQRARSAVEAA